MAKKKEEEIERNPEINEDEEEEEGLASTFGKIIRGKLRTGRKKMVEVE